MKINFTDRAFRDRGLLPNDIDIDLDLADSMDFILEIPINKASKFKSLTLWYVADTEFGGIVDDYTVITKSDIVRYEGRSFRGILDSKIICPPKSEAYKYLQGNLHSVLNSLLKESALDMLFVSNEFNRMFNISTRLKVSRYISLYDVLLTIGTTLNKVLTIQFLPRVNKISLKFTDRYDYSQAGIFKNDALNFEITNSYNSVNHLICLGKGELQNRLVCHLYLTKSGEISEKQSFYGVQEYSSTYEYNNASTLEELKTQGKKKLRDLNKANNKIKVSENNITAIHIGDIVGGYEKFTSTLIRTEVSNFILKVSGDEITLDYEIGGENTDVAGVLPEIEVEYILPFATTDDLGGIKIGNTLSINSNNELNIDLENLENKILRLCFLSK